MPDDRKKQPDESESEDPAFPADEPDADKAAEKIEQRGEPFDANFA